MDRKKLLEIRDHIEEKINKKINEYGEHDDEYYKDCACWGGSRVITVLADLIEIKKMIDNMLEHNSNSSSEDSE